MVRIKYIIQVLLWLIIIMIDKWQKYFLLLVLFLSWWKIDDVIYTLHVCMSLLYELL